jgi:hypothetical protein
MRAWASRMTKAVLGVSVILVAALLSMRIFKRWKAREPRFNPFYVPDPVWTGGAGARLCDNNQKCITVGQNPVQFLDLTEMQSFELFGCDDSTGTCKRDTDVTATFDEAAQTKSQSSYDGPVPSNITLSGSMPLIRLWTEPGYRGRHTTLQGEGVHSILNASYVSDTRTCDPNDTTTTTCCPEGYTCTSSNYYYGRTLTASGCPVAGEDEKGHTCVKDTDGWRAPDMLSFTMAGTT